MLRDATASGAENGFFASVASAASENTDEKFEKFKVQPKNRKAEAVRRVPFVFLYHAAVYHTRDIVEVDEKKKRYEQNHYGGNDHREPAIAVEKVIHGRHKKRNEEHDELNKTNGNKRGNLCPTFTTPNA